MQFMLLHLLSLLRPLLRGAIDRAVDRGQPLSGWAAWCVERDAGLRLYEQSIREVDLRLKQEVGPYLTTTGATNEEMSRLPHWRPLRTGRQVPATKAGYSVARLTASWIAAALLLLVVFFPFLQSPKPAETEQMVSVSLPVMPVKMPEVEKNEGFVIVFNQWDIPVGRLIPESFADAVPFSAMFAKSPEAEPVEKTTLFSPPQQREVCDLIASSNPVCAYLIDCYVRPTFTD